MEHILEVEHLKMYYCGKAETVRAVDGVSFFVNKQETFGIVGESGCGKSTVCKSLVRMMPPPGKIIGGSVRYDGRELTGLSEGQMRAVRGSEIGMIFQDPMTALNPVMKIKDQIYESLRRQNMTKKQMYRRGVELLRLVDIPEPERRMEEYVHQFSGGMRQRVMIAVTLAANPRLLIADEPTTALDVTIQDQIIRLINNLKDELGMSVIIITHDLGVVNEMCDRVAVMYAGHIVEQAETRTLFEHPEHPYTRGLMNSLPRPGSRERLESIPGMPPNLAFEIPGCPFAERCRFCAAVCRQSLPELREIAPDHQVACFRAAEPGDFTLTGEVKA
ncbi:Oligopeptide transport ATP-binding protein OppD [bioreactor metagenome]|uniref:Oligopeptide transport ATP-binding protein OppD n=1 Tax=bioreactor metagenome TaxID=1076179 RepID=A0A644WE05_9ZZZZ